VKDISLIDIRVAFGVTNEAGGSSLVKENGGGSGSDGCLLSLRFLGLGKTQGHLLTTIITRLTTHEYLFASMIARHYAGRFGGYYFLNLFCCGWEGKRVTLLSNTPEMSLWVSIEH